MERMHPGESHEWMDQMMGGEGSDSLRTMHIYMGRNYLGCYDGQYGNYGMGGMMGTGMMGGYGMGMMGPGMTPLRPDQYRDSEGQVGNYGMGSGMMGMMGGFGMPVPYLPMLNRDGSGMSGFGGMSAGWSVFSWISSIILLVLAILGIAALIKYLKGDKK